MEEGKKTLLQWAKDKAICRRGNLNFKNQKMKGIQSQWKNCKAKDSGTKYLIY